MNGRRLTDRKVERKAEGRGGSRWCEQEGLSRRGKRLLDVGAFFSVELELEFFNNCEGSKEAGK